MGVRAIRGATTVEHNAEKDITEETKLLLEEIMQVNDINKQELISIFFTTTKDVNAEFPAVAARELALYNVPLMCAHEMDVPHGIKNCIRIMMHVNTNKSLDDICHIYLKEAKKLRPDLSEG